MQMIIIILLGCNLEQTQYFCSRVHTYSHKCIHSSKDLEVFT